jgi:hypothetical protein
MGEFENLCLPGAATASGRCRPSGLGVYCRRNGSARYAHKPISWLSHTRHAIAVYASWPASPPAHATLVSRLPARLYLGRSRQLCLAPSQIPASLAAAAVLLALHPATSAGKQGKLAVPGANLYYETFGSGPPFVIVPGASGTAFASSGRNAASSAPRAYVGTRPAHVLPERVAETEPRFAIGWTPTSSPTWDRWQMSIP